MMQAARLWVGTLPVTFNPASVDAFVTQTITNWTASGKQLVFLIGEEQPRIANLARQNNFANAWDFWAPNMDFRRIPYNQAIHEAASIEYNKYIIRRLVQAGYQFVDAGVVATDTLPSPWYLAEIEVLRELGITVRSL